jgi:hypothetical protein
MFRVETVHQDKYTTPRHLVEEQENFYHQGSLFEKPSQPPSPRHRRVDHGGCVTAAVTQNEEGLVSTLHRFSSTTFLTNNDDTNKAEKREMLEGFQLTLEEGKQEFGGDGGGSGDDGGGLGLERPQFLSTGGNHNLGRRDTAAASMDNHTAGANTASQQPTSNAERSISPRLIPLTQRRRRKLGSSHPDLAVLKYGVRNQVWPRPENMQRFQRGPSERIPFDTSGWTPYDAR